MVSHVLTLVVRRGGPGMSSMEQKRHSAVAYTTLVRRIEFHIICEIWEKIITAESQVVERN